MLRPRTFKEGSVGLFALLGLMVIGGIAVWLRGGTFGSASYHFLVNFSDANGLQVGAPVNYRGVTVGKVVNIIPGSNGIQADVEIMASTLKMPDGISVNISRYGLLGETAIQIVPDRTLSDTALSMDPLSEDCQEAGEILCNGQELEGQTGSELVKSLTRLSDAYSDPELVNTISETARNASLAAARVATMSEEIATLAKTANGQVANFNRTTQAITGAANNAAVLSRNLNQVVLRNQAHISRTLQESSQLMANLNALVGENRQQVRLTLNSIYQTSENLQALSLNMDEAVVSLNEGLNHLDSQQLAADLSQLLANAVVTSENLRQISTDFNDPTLLLTVQKTLDSARMTFDNVQKITTDVEQITGDPVFMDNLKKLVDGMGRLVSSTEHLQGQLYTAQTLDSTTRQLQFQIAQQQQLADYYQKLQYELLSEAPE